ncbi:hypothetical protein PRIPAC_88158 [Pristionchus pacificus]|uniref:Uncharacterized protein n=1 Tax=Pristionchus pacificus TaxID=54126 RepID=A0A2A6B7H1_PRIPA|nr:hypothetical protein PRIPAC_88158 [Pristionchus pacificus]|eukprot:PDM61803.1 hypothetical protein PRIPAC_51245 [Pristionchus pacificus]
MKVIKPIGDYMPNTPYGFGKMLLQPSIALLAPTFIVLGTVTALGLYIEVHLSTISWMDIMITESACNLTFNSILTLAMTPFLFMPVILVLQLVECFFKINPRWIKVIAYSWAVITGGIRLIQVLFGKAMTSVMCHGCRVIMPLFDIEFDYTQKCRDLSALLGCSIIILGAIGAVLKRFKIPIQFMTVDLHTIKSTFALTFPSVMLIIATKIITSGDYYVHPIVELNLRVVFSSCHLGSISMLLLLLNHPRELWTFITKFLLFQRREKMDVTNKIQL